MLTPFEFTLTILGISFVAGLLGSLVGIGGGIIVVPALTLLFNVPIRLAVGASIVSIIATSSGAAAAYVRERMTNLRVAMLLELGTAAGALTGAFAAGFIAPRALFILFGLLLAYSAYAMLRNAHDHAPRVTPVDAWADRLRLHSAYYDPAQGREIAYRIGRTKIALAIMYVAGILSGLLGIGSGILKVPAMDLLMGMPIKASTATSNFMIGVTAAASAGVYFARGDVDPFIAGPVAIGVLLGAVFGSRLLGRLRNRSIRRGFVVILLVVSVQMLLKGLR